jgi:hypothetical protein
VKLYLFLFFSSYESKAHFLVVSKVLQYDQNVVVQFFVDSPVTFHRSQKLQTHGLTQAGKREIMGAYVIEETSHCQILHCSFFFYLIDNFGSTYRPTTSPIEQVARLA